MLFALVASRALAASSKLAATGWIADDVHIDGLSEISHDACYRAMDYLLTIEPDPAEEAYFQVTDLLNLEVDLPFFDTTSTYSETGEADEPIPRDKDGNRVDEDDEAAVKDTGSAPTGNRRTRATTCRRWWSGWRSPGTGSRCGCGPGRAAPPTPT